MKIELRNLDDKKAVLRAKAELRNTRKFRNVYIRGAQTHAERLIDLNFKAILEELPNGNFYRVTGNGKVVRKEREVGRVERRRWNYDNSRGPGQAEQTGQHSSDPRDSDSSHR